MAKYQCKDCLDEFSEEEVKQKVKGVVPFVKKENLCNKCYQKKNYQEKKRKREVIEVNIYLPFKPHRRAIQIAENWWKLYIEKNELFDILLLSAALLTSKIASA